MPGLARAQTQPLTLRSYWPGYPGSGDFTVALSGDYAYVMGWDAFYVLNVTDPSQPQVTSYLDGLTSWYCHDSAVEVVPPYAYVAIADQMTGGGMSLGIIDIGNPMTPELLTYAPRKMSAFFPQEAS
jgi:hypothetical protein